MAVKKLLGAIDYRRVGPGLDALFSDVSLLFRAASKSPNDTRSDDATARFDEHLLAIEKIGRTIFQIRVKARSDSIIAAGR